MVEILRQELGLKALTALRAAISLAPWLQPGDHSRHFNANRFNGFARLGKPLKRLAAVEMASVSTGLKPRC